MNERIIKVAEKINAKMSESQKKTLCLRQYTDADVHNQKRTTVDLLTKNQHACTLARLVECENSNTIVCTSNDLFMIDKSNKFACYEIASANNNLYKFRCNEDTMKFAQSIRANIGEVKKHDRWDLKRELIYTEEDLITVCLEFAKLFRAYNAECKKAQ